MSPGLATVDLEGVEIARVAGPVRGYGSPTEGEFLSREYLQRVVDDTNEVIAELKPCSKLGHTHEQEMVKASSLFADTDEPALGFWKNIRVEGERVLADAMKVPRKFAELIEAGAYPFRSWETKKFTSQKTGKSYDEVISAVGWLGAKRPAIRTLDEVIALYGEEDTSDLVHVLVFAEADEVDDDAADTTTRMAATKTKSGTERKFAELTDEQMERLAKALGLEADEKLDPEQLVAIAEQVEIVEDDPSKKDEPVKDAPKDEPEADADKPKPEATKEPEKKDEPVKDEPVKDKEPERELAHAMSDAEYHELVTNAKDGAAAMTKLREIERDTFLENAAREGRFPAAKLGEYVKLYDESETLTRKFVTGLEPREEYAKIFGSDDGGDNDADAELYARFSSMAGVKMRDRGDS